jgi:hypothetical protein
MGHTQTPLEQSNLLLYKDGLTLTINAVLVRDVFISKFIIQKLLGSSYSVSNESKSKCISVQEHRACTEVFNSYYQIY